MIEKAMFTAEYNNVHLSGQTSQNLILAAEIISCAKRSIARILVIIVRYQPITVKCYYY